MNDEIQTEEGLAKRDHLDHTLRNLVNDHPFTVSSGVIIISITILKIIRKLRRK
jgi:hypothetical protein